MNLNLQAKTSLIEYLIPLMLPALGYLSDPFLIEASSESGRGVETSRGRFTELVPKRPEISAQSPK